MIGQVEPWELTANQYVAVPLISRADGSIHCLNVLLRSALGLVEWRGETSADLPLLTPMILIDGTPLPLTNLIWERLDRWVPRFRLRNEHSLTITATICTPTGYDAARRGAFYHFEIENHGSGEHQVEIALHGCWTACNQIVGLPRPAAAERRVAWSGARPGIALELAGSMNVALGVAVYGADTSHEAGVQSLTGMLAGAGGQCVLAPAETARFKVARTLRLAPRRRAAATFFMGVAAEREGALATAGAMHRIGAEDLLKGTRLELSRITRKMRDPALGAVLNRNLVFSYFFSVARGIDDERLYPVTTRSPLHPRCATFNERDALLWAMPALLLADPPLARELVVRCFEQYSHRAGEAIRYVDGGVLEPGFMLNQWCAYVLAAGAYVEATGDTGLFDEPFVADVLRELEMGIYTRLHAEVFLAETELLPSGDPADQPYATFGNVLLQAAFRGLAQMRGEESEEGKRSAAAADEIAAAIWRKCMAEVEGLPVLASTTDLEESASVYDDPAGSLQLLPHYKFCEPSEPIWRNTVGFLRSAEYPLWLGDRPFPGLASRSTPNLASMAALCADLLGARRQEALDLFRRLQLTAGVAATHYDPDTGAAAGALHDAALAGFIAHSLHQALNA